ncbi:trypco2 family protein [Streptomyces sp. NPDC002577]
MSGSSRSAADDFDGIELDDAIQALHDQLVSAAARSAGRSIRFDVRDIEMEFAFEFRRETKTGGKLKAWVLEGGADHARASGRVHRVTFTLAPHDARTGRPSQISGSGHDGLPHFGSGDDSR